MSVIIVFGTKIASLGDLGTWATCKANKPIELGENYPRYALNQAVPASSITNSAIFALACWPNAPSAYLLITPVRMRKG